MNRRLLPLLIGALALMVSSCSGTTTSGTSPSTSTAAGATTTATPSASASATGAPTTINTDKQATFATPSGKISCTMNNEFIRCDVQEPTYTIPSNPKCEFDYGRGVTLTGGKAELSCISDALDPQVNGSGVSWWQSSPKKKVGNLAVLPYGYAIKLGTKTCESAAAGVKCSDSANGAGFTLSREKYTLTP